MVMTASRPVEVARETATKSTKRIVPNNIQLGAFRLPRLRFFRVGARPAFPHRYSGFTKVPVHSHAFKSYDYATLGSNPRKPSNQSMPSHIFVVNKVKPLYSRQ